MAFDFKKLRGDFRKLDLVKLSEKLPGPIRYPALSRALDIFIPFNAGLGMQIQEISPERVCVASPERRKRGNHVGGAHACFIALLSEYPAGLLLAQTYSFETYRLIISHLKIEYFKQGRGTLFGTALAPSQTPEFVEGEAFIDMQTTITNVKEEIVARCETRWQLKEWTRVRSTPTN